MITENLKYFLGQFSPEDPWYFGCRFKKFVKQGYMSGGAGYVLSKESLRRFVKNGLTIGGPNVCGKRINTPEDVQMGKCLEMLQVNNQSSHTF